MKEPLINYWYRALHSSVGVEIICSNPANTRYRLYQARAEIKDPELKEIRITISPFDPNKLWLIRRNPSNEAP